jgi:hypothetical protein
MTPAKLTVDFTGVEVRQQSFHFPEGDYLMKVKNVTVGDTKDGSKKQVTWTLACSQPAKYTGKTVFYRNTLTRESLWALRKFLVDLLGEDKVPAKSVDIPLAAIVAKGPEVGVTLTDDEYNGKIRSKVDATFPASEYVEAQEGLDPDSEESEETESDGEEAETDEIDLDDL